MNLKLYFSCSEARLELLKTQYLRAQYIQLPYNATTNGCTNQYIDYSGVSIDLNQPLSLDQTHSLIKKVQKSID